jgi:deoxyuridine 5'-triphosphate nucleotidohydrolase
MVRMVLLVLTYTVLRIVWSRQKVRIFAKFYDKNSLGRKLISTGLQIGIPRNHYGRIAPRSGLALIHFIDVGAGVIDQDYRGEVKVLLFNFGEENFEVCKEINI